jgi:aminoglycoside phosphotransferase (APT) family kinase protein
MSRTAARPTHDATVDLLLEGLATAQGSPLGRGPWRHIRPPRVTPRSTMLFLEGVGPAGGRSRWVVKHANLAWDEDHFAPPLPAETEYQALRRLYAHFHAIGGPASVPEPVALFPEIEAFAMAYVDGRPLRTMLRYPNFLHPAPLLAGISAAAEFIRQVHAVEELPSRSVDLRSEADDLIATANETLHHWNLSLPRETVRVLSTVRPGTVEARQVWLHGDFYLSNMIVGEDGSLVGTDPSLDTIGYPEDDLARCIVMTSSALRFAPETVVRPLGRVRRRLESQLLTGYYRSATYPPLLELRLMRQWVHRWPRLRQLALERERPSLRAARMRLMDAQVRRSMAESTGRLVRRLDADSGKQT